MDATKVDGRKKVVFLRNHKHRLIGANCKLLKLKDTIREPEHSEMR